MNGRSKRKVGSHELLLQRELMELEGLEGVEVISVELESLKEIRIKLTTKEGFFRNRPYLFLLKFKESYPIIPPKVVCQNKIFHPNIDNNGNVCLNILKLDWNPIINLRMMTIGLLLLLSEPSFEEPFNERAAEIMKNDRKRFEEINQKLYDEQFNANNSTTNNALI